MIWLRGPKIIASRLSQDQIDDPTPPDVWSFISAVLENVAVIATSKNAENYCECLVDCSPAGVDHIGVVAAFTGLKCRDMTEIEPPALLPLCATANWPLSAHKRQLVGAACILALADILNEVARETLGENAIARSKATDPAATRLRCLFGNPFRPIRLDPTWRTPNVITLAEAIRSKESFDRMPLLADALEAAGCADPEILHHCRKAGAHVRGCWVVALILDGLQEQSGQLESKQTENPF